MITENIQIKGKVYTLYVNYQDDETLRQEFNRMTQEFWEFDFENYYQSGYWDDSCILYSLFDGDKIVSHTTVSLFEMGEKTLFQLGTVMTDKEYQHRGLSRFLMGRINKDFETKAHGSFLFANETVLDFYPKFDYVSVPEFEAFKTVNPLSLSTKYTKRKLSLDDKKDLSLFEKQVEGAVANSLFAVKSKGLAFFYCYAYPEMGYKDNIYFVDELNCVVIAECEENKLHIVDIFAPEVIDLEKLVSYFSDHHFEEVSLGFTPIESGFEYRTWKDEDLQLLVSPELRESFEQGQVKEPSIAHT